LKEKLNISGADVDAFRGHRATALLKEACFKGYVGMARILLESGAKVNAQSGMLAARPMSTHCTLHLA
jgi:hypothetical protein